MASLIGSLPMWALCLIYVFVMALWVYLFFKKEETAFLKKSAIVGMILAAISLVPIYFIKVNIFPDQYINILVAVVLLANVTLGCVTGLHNVERDKKRIMIGLFILIYVLVVGLLCLIQID